MKPYPQKLQKEKLNKIMEDPYLKDAVYFFTKIGFKAIPYRRKGFNPTLVLKPMVIRWESEHTSLWSSMDIRYKRDNWGNNEGISVDFEYLIATRSTLILMRKRNIIMKINAKALSSARIVVYSKSEHDMHPYATLYLDPTNSYTYAGWKDKEYVNRKESEKYGSVEKLKEFLHSQDGSD